MMSFFGRSTKGQPPQRYASSEGAEGGNLVKSRGGYLAQMTKLYRTAESLMLDKNNADKVRDYSNKVDEAFVNLQQTHAKYVKTLTEPKLLSEADAFWTRQEVNKQEFDAHLTEWLNHAKSVIVPRELSVRSGLLASEAISRASSTLSVKLKQAKVRQTVAELKLKQLKVEQDLQRQSFDLDMKRDLIKLQLEVEMAQAECKVWSEGESEYRMCDEECGEPQVTKLNANAQVSETSRFETKPNTRFDTNPTMNTQVTYTSMLDMKPKIITHDRDTPRFAGTGSPAVADDPSSQLNPRAPPWDFYQHTLNIQADAYQRMALALTESMERPKPEYLSFHGDPSSYWKFMNNFEVNFGDMKDARKKLNYLIQHCQGAAKVAIEDCVIIMDAEQGYQKARQILHSTYGTPHIISRAYISSLVNGPGIKPADGAGLKDLALQMQKCEMTLTQMGYVADLNNSENLLKISRRLPMHVRTRWVERADRIIESGEEPQFHHLAAFVQERARVATNMYAKDLGETQDKGDSHPRYRPTGRAFATQGDGETTSSRNSTLTNIGFRGSQNDASRSPKDNCYICHGTHQVWSCPEFKAKPVDERKIIVRQNQACFNCLSPGHTAKGCLVKGVCKICGRKHHTLLHDPSFGETYTGNPRYPSGTGNGSNHETNFQPTADDTQVKGACNATGAGAKGVFFNVVPVKVLGSGGFVETYAMLDNCSDITLCSERLVEELGIAGTEIEFSLTTVNKESSPQKGLRVNLTVESLDGENQVILNEAYTVDNVPVSGSKIPRQVEVEKWPHLDGIHLDEIDKKSIELIIGADNPEVFWAMEERRGKVKEPYALKSLLGWSVVGPAVTQEAVDTYHVNYIRSGDTLLHKQLEMMWQTEFSDVTVSHKPSMSQEDKRALAIMNETITVTEGHYQLALPWRNFPPNLKNNRDVAAHRMKLLKKRLDKDDGLRAMYTKAMNDYIQKGHASKLSKEALQKAGLVWYIPHHPVFHPHKPDKVRVVFDCAARYQGTSLNEQLLSGPDLTNSLVGVLTRFREAPIALVADIEGMFNQVYVTPSDRDLLRFLWWTKEDLTQEPETYCMNVHLFGATSSPSCATFCLKHVAVEHQGKYDDAVQEVLKRNFYVDDCLKALWTTQEALRMIPQLISLLEERNFKLHKWMSNDPAVIQAVPPEKRASTVADLDLDRLPIERALGIKWDCQSDQLRFESVEKDKPFTRRGILSMVSSLFDPLGLVAPMTLPAKLILQDLCRSNYGWDDPISEDHAKQWREWMSDLKGISEVQVPRCLFPRDFGKPVEVQLHHFSDASLRGYGAVSYLRAKSNDGSIHCAILLGKSRLAPLKTITVPRLELSAAVVATNLDRMLKNELDMNVDRTVFWTDSTSVLQYIHNESRRFQTFVANRIVAIQEQSDPNQWRHVGTAQNPADHASRGIRVNETQKLELWFQGPKFLWEDESLWPQAPTIAKLQSGDPEVKRTVNVNVTESKVSVLQMVIERCSSWVKLQRSVAWLVRYKTYILRRYRSDHREDLPVGDLTLSELRHSTDVIVQHIQHDAYPRECNNSRNDDNCFVSDSSQLRRLSPILKGGLLCVGGRFKNSRFPDWIKHPIILPKNGRVTDLIIEHIHQTEGHSGANHTLAAVRRLYWIVNGKSAVRRVLNRCIPCKRRNAIQGEQFMAPLPEDRLVMDEPPFSRVGLDYFGPILVKRGRGNAKRYGCIFTCLSSRAVHIEVAHALDTDSFLCALRRFTSRRGSPKIMRSDNGTNFKGGDKELRECITAWNQTKISHYLHQKQIEWVYNPPGASHMGGVWERLIRATRQILRALLHEQTVSDETLLTIMTEVECILNDRPLTAISDDPSDLEALTPNHLILLSSNACVPPGLFTKTDGYPVRRWRQAQYLAGIFWRRWLREYIPTLQVRQKWFKPRRNFQDGDLVLVTCKNEPRGQWPLGRVTETHADKQGLVRSVKVRTANGLWTRPVTSLCLLEAQLCSEVECEKDDLAGEQCEGDFGLVSEVGLGGGPEVDTEYTRCSRRNKGKKPGYLNDYEL